MEPGLAAKHPEIKTYAGRGLDDPAATVRADTTPLGFHASVRGPKGAWYIDPYYHLDDSVYVSYYGRDLVADPDGAFVERDLEGDTDPLNVGAFAAPAGPEITLRTYRLALVTDPTLLDLLRRPRERDRRQGHADEPRRPGLRGRDGDPDGPDRRQRQAQPQHGGRHDRRQRPVRRGRVLHAGAGEHLRRRDADPQPGRHRPARRRVQLRHRAHRARRQRRRRRAASASSAATARRAAAPACRHRSATSSPSTTWPTRWATSSPATTRSTAPSQLRGRQPQRRHVGRARQRLVDHGLRGHLPAGQPAAPQRPVLVAAQLRRDHRVHVVRRCPDQRGPDLLAARLRRRPTRSR